MKTFLLAISIIFAIFQSSHAQVEKTLVKSIATSSTTAVSHHAVANLPGQTNISLWNENFIRITTHLKVENMNENIVKQLVMVGRYTINSQINESTNTLLIHMPKMSNTITVKGAELSEILEFEVKIPKGYDFRINQSNEVVLGQSL